MKGQLTLDSYHVERDAFILTNDTNDPAVHTLTAWRTYNEGALIEQRIEELGQMAVGRTAVNDIRGNKLLWALGALTYQPSGRPRWTAAGARRSQTGFGHGLLDHAACAQKTHVQLVRDEPLLAALRSLKSLQRLSVA
jgi:hypothetical protein